MAEEKRKVRITSAWREARSLVYAHRGRLALGLGILLVNRLAGLVLPSTSKFLVDEVVTGRREELLLPLALAGGAATLVQAATSFGLTQVLGVAAQRAIADLRKDVQAHVLRLPVRWYDSTQSGALISRIMNDAEGIRNLVGTGVVELVGGSITAVIALGVLFWLNAQLTLVILVVLAAFGAAMGWAFRKLRPIFRERGKIQAETTGRLGQTLGGIRVVKAYVAEPAEQRTFARDIDRLFGNIKSSMTAISGTTAFSIAIVGVTGVLMTLFGGRSILAGEMTLGDFVMYLVFIGLVVVPAGARNEIPCSTGVPST